MSTVTVDLYWADWCGHCIRFKPIWKEIVEMATNGQIKKNDVVINVVTNDFAHIGKTKKEIDEMNEKELEKLSKEHDIPVDKIKKDIEKIEEINIEGFPTIKINNVIYEGPREKDQLLEAISKADKPETMARHKKNNLSQQGGGKDYVALYREYKQKYLELKKKLGN